MEIYVYFNRTVKQRDTYKSNKYSHQMKSKNGDKLFDVLSLWFSIAVSSA